MQLVVRERIIAGITNLDQSLSRRFDWSVDGSTLHDPLRAVLQGLVPDYAVELDRMESGFDHFVSSDCDRRSAEMVHEQVCR